MKKLLLVVAASGLLAACQGQVFHFIVPLSGAQEAPGPGDADGFGTADVFLNAADNSISWSITVNNIDLPITADHIHQGVAGVPGPVVINFSAQLVGGPIIDSDVANVLANPSGWYVNVHTTAFPGGAIRGQMAAAQIVVPEPSWYAFGTAIALGAVALGRKATRRRLGV